MPINIDKPGNYYVVSETAELLEISYAETKELIENNIIKSTFYKGPVPIILIHEDDVKYFYNNSDKEQIMKNMSLNFIP